MRIKGYDDEVFSVPGLLEAIAKGERAGCQGSIIACFDDTGLDATRALARGPVVGIAQRHTRVWFCRRIDIAHHWHAHHQP